GRPRAGAAPEAAAPRRAEPRARADRRRAAAARRARGGRGHGRGGRARRAAHLARARHRRPRLRALARRDRPAPARAGAAPRPPAARRELPRRAGGGRRPDRRGPRPSGGDVSDPVPGFTERAVEADGFTIRVLEAGAGRPLVYFHGGGGLHVSPAHRLLAERFRVSAFELPGFGESPENTRTATLDELAATMAAAVAAAGIDRYALYGTSFGAATALRLAVAFEERLESLVLESPAAFRDPAVNPSALTPDELRRALFVRPENGPPPQPLPVIQKQLALLNRLIGPAADPELRERMRGLAVPTLVVVGRSDGL